MAVRVPKSFAAALDWGENTPVAMALDDGALVVKTDRTRAWDLDALLAEVTDENIHPAIAAEGEEKDAEERRQAGGGGG